jgi:hypothetical protein
LHITVSFILIVLTTAFVPQYRGLLSIYAL